MDLTLLRAKADFPLYVKGQLDKLPIDYSEKNRSIVHSHSHEADHLEAGVVLLLSYRESGYVFQLIKRSDAVAQAGDISCPGGMLERSTDEMLRHIVLKTGIIRSADNRMINDLPNKDAETISLVTLFLMNALREAWEEIGLSPLNVSFLGALPTYTLAFFPRTIFPVVCLVKDPCDYRLNPEVEKIVEIPLIHFFQNNSYAMLEVESEMGSSDPRYNMKFPCMVITDDCGHEEILWGATFYIVTNFLQMIFGDPLPFSKPSRRVKKTLSSNYTSGRR